MSILTIPLDDFAPLGGLRRLGWVLVLVLQLLTTSARTHSIRGRVLVLVALVLVCVYRSTSIRILIPVVPHQYASVL